MTVKLCFKCLKKNAVYFLDITKNSSVIRKEYSAVSVPVVETTLSCKPHPIV